MTEREFYDKLKNMEGDGEGLKIGIFESLSSDHHLIVASIYKKYVPKAKLYYYQTTGSGWDSRIKQMLADGIHICNMSFAGWNPDDVEGAERYRNIRTTADIDDTHDDETARLYYNFFNKVLCVCASANTGEKTETSFEFPAATDIWKDEVISVGAVRVDVYGNWVDETFSTGNCRVDFGLPDATYYNGSYKYGTSFSAPKAGVIGAKLMCQMPELIGQPRVIVRLMRNQVIDIEKRGYDIYTGHGIICPRDIMDREERFEFTDGAAEFLHNGNVETVIGCNGKPEPTDMRNGVTKAPIRKVLEDGYDNLMGTINAGSIIEYDEETSKATIVMRAKY